MPVPRLRNVILFGVDLGPGGESLTVRRVCRESLAETVSANPGSRGVCLALYSNPPFFPPAIEIQSSHSLSRGGCRTSA